MRMTSGVRHAPMADLSAADCAVIARLLRSNYRDIHARARTGADRAEHSCSAGQSKTNLRDLGHLRAAWLKRKALFAELLANLR
jgi:hypothetical protein